jgi:hypothetical protein
VIPCLKQRTRCVIITDHATYEATNACAVDGLDVCPRVTAGCATGTGYELCGSTHAEANAAALKTACGDTSPGIAVLYGHDYFCRECQHALAAVNVTVFRIAKEPA